MQTEADKTIPDMMTLVGIHEGRVTVTLWHRGEAGALDVRLSLTEVEARHLAAQLIAKAGVLPRIGTPADLGCTTL